jgi:3-methyl-2-oxobutanoate hydroxymethyltransferase
MYDRQSPKFSKRYAALNETIKDSVTAYVTEVKTAQFPEEKHTFTIDDAVIAALQQ